MTSGEHKREDDDVEVQNVDVQNVDKQIRQPFAVLTIAALGLVIITGTATAALAYKAAFFNGSTDALSTLAAVGLGALAGILGTNTMNNKKE